MLSIRKAANDVGGLSPDQLKKCPVHCKYEITTGLVQRLASIGPLKHSSAKPMLKAILEAFMPTQTWDEADSVPLVMKWYYAFLSSIVDVSALLIKYDPQSDYIECIRFSRDLGWSDHQNHKPGLSREAHYTQAMEIFGQIIERMPAGCTKSSVNERFRVEFVRLATIAEGLPHAARRLHPVHRKCPMDSATIRSLRLLKKETEDGGATVPRQIGGKSIGYNEAIRWMGTCFFALAACVPHQPLGALKWK